MGAFRPRRIAAVVSVLALFGIADSRAAFAQDRAELLIPPSVFAAAEMAAVEARPFELRPVVRPAVRPPARPAPLLGLYVSLAGLQALDIASTHTALKAGAAEANPMMAPFARSPLALAAVKGGVTGATIFATEQMWKTNRKAALVTMIVLNATYGAIAAHNYRVAAAQRR
jgi:hypothetical protein